MEINLNQRRIARKKKREFGTKRKTSALDPLVVAEGESNAQLKVPAERQIFDGPDVTEAIGKIFQSKTEERQRRKDEGLQSKSYQKETQRPIVSLAFVLPILIFYEIGSILLGPEALRSGVDQWVHQLLSQIGFGELLVLPLMTVGLILAWHHRIDDHWRIQPGTLIAMFIEAAGLGLILFCAANSLNLLFGGGESAVQSAMDLSNAWWANVVSHVGSGIYEELVFRILLLSTLVYLFSQLCNDRKLATAIGVFVVSLIFAAVHYRFFNPAGNPFEMSSFFFRFGASIVFCLLFLFRGFGIAVGTHVAYDVLTQI